MANDIVAFRLLPEEKHALKIMAAEADMTLTDYVLAILRRHTALGVRAQNLATSIRKDEQNIRKHEEAEPVTIA